MDYTHTGGIPSSQYLASKDFYRGIIGDILDCFIFAYMLDKIKFHFQYKVLLILIAKALVRFVISIKSRAKLVILVTFRDISDEKYHEKHFLISFLFCWNL